MSETIIVAQWKPPKTCSLSNMESKKNSKKYISTRIHKYTNTQNTLAIWWVRPLLRRNEFGPTPWTSPLQGCRFTASCSHAPPPSSFDTKIFPENIGMVSLVLSYRIDIKILPSKMMGWSPWKEKRVPDFDIFWGEWTHIELTSWLDRSSGTFFSWGSLKACCEEMCYYRYFKLKKKHKRAEQKISN